MPRNERRGTSLSHVYESYLAMVHDDTKSNLDIFEDIEENRWEDDDVDCYCED